MSRATRKLAKRCCLLALLFVEQELPVFRTSTLAATIVDTVPTSSAEQRPFTDPTTDEADSSTDPVMGPLGIQSTLQQTLQAPTEDHPPALDPPPSGSPWVTDLSIDLPSGPATNPPTIDPPSDPATEPPGSHVLVKALDCAAAAAAVAAVPATLQTTAVLGLNALGFSSAGPVAGSVAAGWMSSIAAAAGGAVPAGSAYAVLQSAAMTLPLVTPWAAVAGVGAGAYVGGRFIVKRWRGRMVQQDVPAEAGASPEPPGCTTSVEDPESTSVVPNESISHSQTEESKSASHKHNGREGWPVTTGKLKDQ